LTTPYHELTVQKGTEEEVRTHLERIATLLREVHGQAFKRDEIVTGTDTRGIMLANLAARSSIEAARLAEWLGAPTEQVAWVARNLYELNLRVHFILMSKENVDRFFAESISDEIQLFRAIKTLFTPGDPGDAANLKAIDDRIAAREARLAQEGLVPVKSMGCVELAKEIGAESEHQAFYKLYSKYVHPTGYLINRRTGWMPKINEAVVRLLLVNAQQYAIDTLRRIAGAFGLSGQVLAGTEEGQAEPRAAPDAGRCWPLVSDSSADGRRR